MIHNVSSASASSPAHQTTQQTPPKQTKQAKPPQDTVHLSAAAKAASDKDHDGD
jgi:hypothetical protein